MLEGRTSLLGLRHAGRDVRWHGCRILSITDNLSSLFAFEKMRSRSRALLTFCRRAAAFIIACGFLWRLRYSESARNPTGRDSRLADAGLIRPGVTQHGPRGAIDQLEKGLSDRRRTAPLTELPAMQRSEPEVWSPEGAVSPLHTTQSCWENLEAPWGAQVVTASMQPPCPGAFAAPCQAQEPAPPPGLEHLLAPRRPPPLFLELALEVPTLPPPWVAQCVPCGSQRVANFEECQARMQRVAARAAARPPRAQKTPAPPPSPHAGPGPAVAH